MGMTGCYIALDGNVLQQLRNNTLDLLDIDEEECVTLDIDKSWQAIQFLLCKEASSGASPLGYVVPLGQRDNILDAEPDYQFACFLTPEQTRKAYKAIEGMSEKELRQQYDYRAMVKNNIYPIVEEDNEDDFFDYIFGNFMELKMFYKETSQQNQGVVFYIM